VVQAAAAILATSRIRNEPEPEKFIVPVDVMPVSPLAAPAEFISHVFESTATEFEFPPILTAPVDVPVFMLVAKFEFAFKFTLAPVDVKPAVALMAPVEVSAGTKSSALTFDH
jgi:hypothetical protein